jgi:hypothetical protein
MTRGGMSGEAKNVLIAGTSDLSKDGLKRMVESGGDR